MKKIISTLIAALLAVSSLPSVMAAKTYSIDCLVNDDFRGYEEGVPSGWISADLRYLPVKTEVDAEHGTSVGLKGGSCMYVDLNNLDEGEIFDASFEVYSPQGSGMWIRLTDNDVQGQFWALRFENGGVYTRWSNKVADYNVSEWVKVRMVVDVVDNSYTLYINNEKVLDESAEFYSESWKVLNDDYLQFGVGNIENPALIDNVNIVVSNDGTKGGIYLPYFNDFENYNSSQVVPEGMRLVNGCNPSQITAKEFEGYGKALALGTSTVIPFNKILTGGAAVDVEFDLYLDNKVIDYLTFVPVDSEANIATGTSGMNAPILLMIDKEGTNGKVDISSWTKAMDKTLSVSTGKWEHIKVRVSTVTNSNSWGIWVGDEYVSAFNVNKGTIYGLGLVLANNDGVAQHYIDNLKVTNAVVSSGTTNELPYIADFENGHDFVISDTSAITVKDEVNGNSYLEVTQSGPTAIKTFADPISGNAVELCFDVMFNDIEKDFNMLLVGDSFGKKSLCMYFGKGNTAVFDTGYNEGSATGVAKDVYEANRWYSVKQIYDFDNSQIKVYIYDDTGEQIASKLTHIAGTGAGASGVIKNISSLQFYKWNDGKMGIDNVSVKVNLPAPQVEDVKLFEGETELTGFSKITAAVDSAVISFSTSMSLASLNANTSIKDSNGNDIKFTGTLDNNVYKLNFLDELKADSEYTIVIGEEATNLMGGKIGEEKVYTITTASGELKADITALTVDGVAVTDVADLTEGCNLAFNMDVRNTFGETEEFVIILAYYNNDALVDIDYSVISTPDYARYATLKAYKTVGSLENVNSIKAFAWDGINTIIPISDALEL